MDIKEILFQLEEDIERAAIIKHHAEAIYRKVLMKKTEDVANKVKIRAESLLDDLFGFIGFYFQKVLKIKEE